MEEASPCAGSEIIDPGPSQQLPPAGVLWADLPEDWMPNWSPGICSLSGAGYIGQATLEPQAACASWGPLRGCGRPCPGALPAFLWHHSCPGPFAEPWMSQWGVCCSKGGSREGSLVFPLCNLQLLPRLGARVRIGIK